MKVKLNGNSVVSKKSLLYDRSSHISTSIKIMFHAGFTQERCEDYIVIILYIPQSSKTSQGKVLHRKILPYPTTKCMTSLYKKFVTECMLTIRRENANSLDCYWSLIQLCFLQRKVDVASGFSFNTTDIGIKVNR